MIGLALSVVGGLYVSSLGLFKIELVMVSAFLLITSGFLFLRSKGSSLLVFAGVAFVAAIHFLLSDGAGDSTSIDQRFKDLPEPNIEVVGRVNAQPKYYAFKTGNRGMWIFPLCVEGVHDGDFWLTQSGEIDVRVMGALESEPSATQGQRVWLKGELQERNYRGGNPLGMKVPWPRCCMPLGNPRLSPMAWCQDWRESVAQRLEVGISEMPTQLAVLRSLVLGYRKEIPAETYDCFKRTGALHIFAISGLHVGIVGLLLVIVLKSFGIPRDWFGVFLLPLLFFYVAATGLKASALRAMVMAAVFLLAPLFRRKPDIPSSVAFAAMVLLLLNPGELSSAGFVFSFVVVAFIVMVYTAVPDRWLTGSWIRRYALSLAITSVAASLASMPMTAYYFGRFSPVALVGNLAVVPLTFCIVLSGWLSILIPPVSAVFNHASVVFINAMLWCVERLDHLPGSSFAVEAPPVFSILLWYGSLIYMLVHASCRRQRAYALAGACGSVLCAVLF